MSSLEIGLVIEVKNNRAKIATFDNMNHNKLIYEGNLINNIKVNSFIVMNQGFTKIIGRIYSESVWDTQHSHKEYNLDSRFSKKSIRRVLEVETVGYIEKNKFYSGASYFPMIGNRCTIPSQKDINCIYLNNYLQDQDYEFIKIGVSLNEQAQINLPINPFIASHIGIFGNTGSGKSNTLHKLYYELFKTSNLFMMKCKSKFIVLDLNGEYTGDQSFGITDEKEVFDIGGSEGHKIKVNLKTFLEPEMLAILLDAKPATQVPFLKRIINGINKYGMEAGSICNFALFVNKYIFTVHPNITVKNMFINTLKTFYDGLNEVENVYSRIETYDNGNKLVFRIQNSKQYFDGSFGEIEREALKFNYLQTIIQENPLDVLKEIELRAKLHFILDILDNRVQYDHISPLINRIETTFKSLSNYISIEDVEESKFIQIFSFKNIDNRDKQLLSMLIAKQQFDKQVLGEKISTHLIIDEAHNILSAKQSNEIDTWKDYRLDLFERIIKEGRKFGFFLTLSSQRPADISPTILSQVHNFFIHKLVNERDLQIIENSVSSLDSVGKSKLPTLPKGVCVISGDALSMPITVLVDFNNDIHQRPQSDTVNLVNQWRLF